MAFFNRRLRRNPGSNTTSSSITSQVAIVVSDLHMEDPLRIPYRRPDPEYIAHYILHILQLQASIAGNMGSYGGRFHPEYLQRHSQPQPHLHPHLHPHPWPPLLQPHDLHEAINREIEKQLIREEIIVSEIARRRVLEAEVRRELMMERELALRRGDDGFPFGRPLGTGLDFTIRPPHLGIRCDGRSLAERVTVPHKEKEKERQNVRHVNGELETVPFQRCITVPKISAVTPVSEAVKEKEKETVVVLAKPQEYKPGETRKAANSSVADDAELLSAAVARRKAKQEWSCALCQVIASSEQALTDHVQGKKHKSKTAALRGRRAGKDYSIGFFPKKAVAPVGTKSVGSDGVISATRSAAVASKKAKEQWNCALCQVIAASEQALKDHIRGKKHKSKEAALRAQRAGKDYSICSFPKKAVAPVGAKTVGSDGVISATYSLQNKMGEMNSKNNQLSGVKGMKNAGNGKNKTGEMNSKNNLQNNQLSGVEGMKNAGNGKKKEYKFWREILPGRSLVSNSDECS